MTCHPGIRSTNKPSGGCPRPELGRTASDSFEAKRGFVLLPRRWVVERSFGWMARFRRLARNYERLATTLVGLHFVAFIFLLLRQAAPLLARGP